MNFRIKLQDNIAERTYFNTLTDDVAFESRNAMKILNNNKPISKQLLNFLHLKEMKLSTGFIEKIAEEDCKEAKGQTLNYAVITKMPSMFGLLRQYQTYLDRCNLKMQIFDNYNDGKHWLKAA